MLKGKKFDAFTLLGEESANERNERQLSDCRLLLSSFAKLVKN